MIPVVPANGCEHYRAEFLNPPACGLKLTDQLEGQIDLPGFGLNCG
ncbi:hypothetical protein SAMN05216387_10811 [Nitrosovibrio tenuis]|uniref:Uncharacterized protein n=1 Tax=Nitrosovibrio tenuis TaxID=1233 RepID=A0A1H7P1K9_9PROT|nr:hypothetical protein SAMN05216387_10811 [Nitrosovibrio tenuis]